MCLLRRGSGFQLAQVAHGSVRWYECKYGFPGARSFQGELGTRVEVAGVDCWLTQPVGHFVCPLHLRGLGVVRLGLDLVMVNYLPCPFEIVGLGY